MDGWISIHRKIKDHWVWNEKPFSKGQAWIDLLMMANYEDKKVLLGSELVEVKRGSRITSEVKLSERWGWSRTKVRSFLSLLEQDNMLIKKSDNKKTVLTIVNYSDYQVLETAEEQQKNSDETSKEQQKNTNNKENKDNKDNNKDIYSQNKSSNTPYKEIIKAFNNICVSFPGIERITDKRKRAMRARWKKYNDLEIYKKIFQMAEDSDFLSGRNGKWTNCNFDWLINENNMVKVLEGNYNRGGKNGTGKSTTETTEEKTLLDLARERGYKGEENNNPLPFM